MAYRVWVGNIAIDCDSPEEAIALAKQAEGQGSSTPRANTKSFERNTEAGSRWTEKRAQDFFRLIEGKQRKLIDAMLEHDGQTDGQLLQLLSLDNGKQLAGVFSGIWKNAKKVGADPNDLYVKRAATIAGERAYEYFISDGFKRVAQQVPK